MTLMVAGLFLWVAVHLFPSLMPVQRNQLIGRVGNIVYQGIFALLIIIGIVCIVMGWRSTVPSLIYAPPSELQLPAKLLIVLGFILMVAANFPATRIKRFIRHPQLTGVLLWSIGHLFVNGDSRSVLVFSVIGIWCMASVVTINRRDGNWIKPGKTMPKAKEVLIPIIGIVLSGIAVYFHGYLSGVPLIQG